MKKIVLIVLIVLLAAAAVIGGAYTWLANAKVETIEAVQPAEIVEETETTETVETADSGAAAQDASADEEEVIAEIAELYGKITEITDEYVMIVTEGLGDVKVMLSEDTIIEGVEALALGQTVKVMYSGMMTRSLPPQITALLIGVYAVTGEVTAVEEGRVTIANESGEVILTLPESAAAPAVGDAIIAYTTGVSTMSLPPQMNAVAIETADSVG